MDGRKVGTARDAGLGQPAYNFIAVGWRLNPYDLDEPAHASIGRSDVWPLNFIF